MAALLLRGLVARAARPLLPLGGAAAAPRALASLLLDALRPGPQPALGFKTKAVLRKRCKDCYKVKRRGRWYIYCKTHPRHKQRQA